MTREAWTPASKLWQARLVGDEFYIGKTMDTRQQVLVITRGFILDKGIAAVPLTSC